MSSVTQILKDYGDKVILGARKTLADNKAKKKSGGDASSALSQSVRFLPLKIFGNTFEMVWVAEDYWYWVDHGRKPGKFPPLKPIERWITEKEIINRKTHSKGLADKSKANITQSILEKRKTLAFLIGRKLKREGYKGSKFFTNQVNKESLSELRKTLSIQIGQDAILELKLHSQEVQK